MVVNKKEAIAIKYRQRLAKQLGIEEDKFVPPSQPKQYSSNYVDFKRANTPKKLTLYENLCKYSAKIIRIHPGEKRKKELEKFIALSHLDITPTSTMSFAVLTAALLFLMGIGVAFFLQSVFAFGYVLIADLIVVVSLMKLPEFFANGWRLQASNQMVQCIFYMATYMRHTSNLELAVRFAADRLSPPLSLDLKKVLWDVETQKYETIKESLDHYLDSWREWNLEFIESFHLLEGSLFEPSEDKRLTMVDKALNLMLEETYNRMLRYTHDLKGPITLLYMLGLVLPILGLVLLPMIASFLTSDIGPYALAAYIALFYNFTIPALLYYLTRTTLSKRPTGYGDQDIADEIPALRKYRNILIPIGRKQLQIHPVFLSISVFVVLLLIGMLPWFIQFMFSAESLVQELPFDETFQFKLWDYRWGEFGNLIGPYGMGAAVLSFFVVLAFGLGAGLYYRLRSANVYKIREQSKKLEDEFAAALFHLGNRIGDGVPVEVAVGSVADIMKSTTAGEFFALVSQNISKRGMNVEKAIFDKKHGAISHFPSPTIESAMKVLIESSKKGPKVASTALINVSEYIKDIHRVDQRLNDLMADIISDMKQQVSLLAPAIAAIVVGITSMIISILGRLSNQLADITNFNAGSSAPVAILEIFGDGIPTYYFQIIIGLYIVQVIYIMTILINGIESGADKLSERFLLGNNLIKSTLIYIFIALAVTVIFNAIAASIITGIATA